MTAPSTSLTLSRHCRTPHRAQKRHTLVLRHWNVMFLVIILSALCLPTLTYAAHNPRQHPQYQPHKHHPKAHNLDSVRPQGDMKNSGGFVLQDDDGSSSLSSSLGASLSSSPSSTFQKGMIVESGGISLPSGQDEEEGTFDIDITEDPIPRVSDIYFFYSFTCYKEF